MNIAERNVHDYQNSIPCLFTYVHRTSGKEYSFSGLTRIWRTSGIPRRIDSLIYQVFFQIWKRVLISWGFSALQKVICVFRNSEATHLQSSPVAPTWKVKFLHDSGWQGSRRLFLLQWFCPKCFLNLLMFKGNGVLYDSGCLLSRLSDFYFNFSEYLSL